MDPKSKGAASPAVKEEGGGEDTDELEGYSAREFRALAARANYLGQDRMDVQYSVKGILRIHVMPHGRKSEEVEGLSEVPRGRARGPGALPLG